MRPCGEFTIFTLFPWAGFVFAGGAVGALIAAARDERAERRLHAILGASASCWSSLGFYTAGRPSIYASSSFWTSSPTWFAIRVGILMIALTAIYASSRCSAAMRRRAARAARALSWQIRSRRLGRSSLFIYWIHVELVYGYAELAVASSAAALGHRRSRTRSSASLMYRAIGWRDLAVDGGGTGRGRPRHAPQTATA